MKEELREMFHDMEDVIGAAGSKIRHDEKYYKSKFWDYTYKLDDILNKTLENYK
jgi:hypothetical protein